MHSSTWRTSVYSISKVKQDFKFREYTKSFMVKLVMDLLLVPLTARLIRISSKSLWSSMAATSQRYSAVSFRDVLKIRMLAGSLSWALFSKSPFFKETEKKKKRLYNRSLTSRARLQFKTFGAKFFKVFKLVSCWMMFVFNDVLRGLPDILFWK